MGEKKYIELIDKYLIKQGDGDYNPPSYEWVDNTGEIVRCKDCKYWHSDALCCSRENHYIVNAEVNDYCSYGERKDGRL